MGKGKAKGGLASEPSDEFDGGRDDKHMVDTAELIARNDSIETADLTGPVDEEVDDEDQGLDGAEPKPRRYMQGQRVGNIDVPEPPSSRSFFELLLGTGDGDAGAPADAGDDGGDDDDAQSRVTVDTYADEDTETIGSRTVSETTLSVTETSMTNSELSASL